MVGYVAARQDAIPPNGKSPAYPTDRKHQTVLKTDASGQDLQSGYALPTFLPRSVLILFVAQLSS
jgi:hypothetical protein